MGVALLDSSAVIAYLFGDDPLHQAAAEAIESAVRGGASLAISAVSWAELLGGEHHGHQTQQVVRDLIGEFGVAILAVDAQVAEQAAALQAGYARKGRGRDRPRLRTPDALILATAVVHDAIDVVICGDVKWSRVPGVPARVLLLRSRSST